MLLAPMSLKGQAVGPERQVRAERLSDIPISHNYRETQFTFFFFFPSFFLACVISAIGIIVAGGVTPNSGRVPRISSPKFWRMSDSVIFEGKFVVRVYGSQLIRVYHERAGTRRSVHVALPRDNEKQGATKEARNSQNLEG